MVYGQCLTTMVTTSRRSSGQDMGFGGLGMANSKSGDYNLFSSGWVLELLRWPQCWFHKIEISAMYSYIPLGLKLKCRYVYFIQFADTMFMNQDSGPWFNIKMLYYKYRKSHCGDKTVVRLSYLHNGISYTGTEMSSVHWIRAKAVQNFQGKFISLKDNCPSHNTQVREIDFQDVNEQHWNYNIYAVFQ